MQAASGVADAVEAERHATAPRRPPHAAASANLAPKIRDLHFKRQIAANVFIKVILLEITISFAVHYLTICTKNDLLQTWYF